MLNQGPQAILEQPLGRIGQLCSLTDACKLTSTAAHLNRVAACPRACAARKAACRAGRTLRLPTDSKESLGDGGGATKPLWPRESVTMRPTCTLEAR